MQPDTNNDSKTYLIQAVLNYLHKLVNVFSYLVLILSLKLSSLLFFNKSPIDRNIL